MQLMLHYVTMNTKTSITINPADLLTATRAAGFLGVSRMTLWRWVRDGKIRPVEVDNRRFFNISELKIVKEARELARVQPAEQEFRELDKMWDWCGGTCYQKCV
jgi:excisionase family DNA binding protein